MQDSYLEKLWITKSNLTRRNFLEEKVNKKKKLTKEKIYENKSKLKEPWWTLKCLGIPS